jgi:hypothetical protein
MQFLKKFVFEKSMFEKTILENAWFKDIYFDSSGRKTAGGIKFKG